MVMSFFSMFRPSQTMNPDLSKGRDFSYLFEKQEVKV
jgi:hypothetical protein